jgi:hypothetical protein
MGAQWKQAGREASAHKKGQMVVKLVREITAADVGCAAAIDAERYLIAKNE